MKNRKNLPPEVRAANFKMVSNEVKAWRSGKALVVAWRHEKKKPVVMLSTVSSAAPTRALVGQRRQPVMKPEVVVRYNNAMGGVDVADQYCVYYSFTRKSVKSYGNVLGNRGGFGKQLHTDSSKTSLTLAVSTGDHPKPLQHFFYWKCQEANEIFAN